MAKYISQFYKWEISMLSLIPYFPGSSTNLGLFLSPLYSNCLGQGQQMPSILTVQWSHDIWPINSIKNCWPFLSSLNTFFFWLLGSLLVSFVGFSTSACFPNVSILWAQARALLSSLLYCLPRKSHLAPLLSMFIWCRLSNVSYLIISDRRNNKYKSEIILYLRNNKYKSKILLPSHAKTSFSFGFPHCSKCHPISILWLL